MDYEKIKDFLMSQRSREPRPMDSFCTQMISLTKSFEEMENSNLSEGTKSLFSNLAVTRLVTLNETHLFFPADESAPIELTFSLDNGEKYIMYTREVIVFMPEQLISVEKSNEKGKGLRSIACAITFDKLVVATTDGNKHFIKLNTPTVHKATKGRGC